MKKVVYGVSNVIPAILHHAYYTSYYIKKKQVPISTSDGELLTPVKNLTQMDLSYIRVELICGVVS